MAGLLKMLKRAFPRPASACRTMATAPTPAAVANTSFPALLLYIPTAFTAALGAWQLVRYDDKVRALAERQRRLAAPPLDGPALLAAAASPAGGHDPLAFRRAALSGTWDDARSLYVGPRTRPESVMGQPAAGWLLLTPLRLAGGGEVLVERGWVPTAHRVHARPAPPPAAVPAAPTPARSRWWPLPPRPAPIPPAPETRVDGVVRNAESPSAFVPANDAAAGRWFWVDPPALATAAGLPPTTPLVQALDGGASSPQEGAGGPLPLPRDASTLLRERTTPQDHLNYAATWWLLSAATAALARRATRGGVMGGGARRRERGAWLRGAGHASGRT